MAAPIASWNSQRDVWETDQGDLISGHWVVFSETFPTSGSMRNGTAYALPTSEPATDDSGCSYLPTPVASEGTKPSNTMGVARRLQTGQVFLTNVIVTLCGLDPTER